MVTFNRAAAASRERKRTTCSFRPIPSTWLIVRRVRGGPIKPLCASDVKRESNRNIKSRRRVQ